MVVIADEGWITCHHVHQRKLTSELIWSRNVEEV
jgi:hypothetical protein